MGWYTLAFILVIALIFVSLHMVVSFAIGAVSTALVIKFLRVYDIDRGFFAWKYSIFTLHIAIGLVLCLFF